MKEAKILLPTHDNIGRDLQGTHHWLKKRLAERFDGWSAYGGIGGYTMADGSLKTEAHVAYVVVAAAERDGYASATEWLIDTAAQLARECEQEAIYLRLPSGNVEFVTENGLT